MYTINKFWLFWDFYNWYIYIYNLPTHLFTYLKGVVTVVIESSVQVYIYPGWTPLDSGTKKDCRVLKIVRITGLQHYNFTKEKNCFIAKRVICGRHIQLNFFEGR